MIPHFTLWSLGFSLTFFPQILPNIQNNKLLHKPNSCPDWVYNMMQQCWRYNPKHRPPFIALFEELSRRFVIGQQRRLYYTLNYLLDII